MLALRHPECVKHLGPLVPGANLAGGVRAARLHQRRAYAVLACGLADPQPVQQERVAPFAQFAQAEPNKPHPAAQQAKLTHERPPVPGKRPAPAMLECGKAQCLLAVEGQVHRVAVQLQQHRQAVGGIAIVGCAYLFLSLPMKTIHTDMEKLSLLLEL